MKGLYKLEADCGRMGELSGVFVADTDEFKKHRKKTVYMEDVLGKHSEVDFVLGDYVKLVTTDEDFIAKAEKYKLVPAGINPMDWIE